MEGIIYTPIGWLYLWIRYRNKEKVKKALEEKYEGTYSTAGVIFVMSVFGITLIGLLSLFLLVVIGRILYDLVT